MRSVSIQIPASPRYVELVRLVASGLASRLKFTIDEIEDLKIGVDELSVYLTGAHGRPGTIDIRFDLHDDGIEIHGRGRFAPGHRIRTELTELSRMILSTVADEASLEQSEGIPTFALSKRKTIASGTTR